MKRCVVPILLLLVVTSAKLLAQEQRPNIVFIITDDQRADWLGVAGHPDLRTPNIDRLANEGARFTEFFVTTPLCSPSRASFLTGQYAHKHLVTNNDRLGIDVIGHSLYTFPRRLREAGYETAFVGKWHMGLDDSRRPGFDYWVSFKGQGQYIDPVVNENGTRLQLTGYITDYLNRKAVEFVSQPRSQPFLLYLSHKAVHNPFLPAARFDSLYTDVTYHPPEVTDADIKGKPALHLNLPTVPWYELESIAPEPGEPRCGRGKDPGSIIRDQMRTLMSVDEGLGMLFDVLTETGQLDNTVVIFTSDNGFLLGEHGRFNDKRLAYDESIRIPFIIRYPPLVTPGTIIDAMTLNVDVAPTLLDIAGVTPITPVNGRSFVPLLRDPNADWRESMLTEYFLEKVAPNARPWQSVRTEHWKYIRYTDLEGMDELYDLQADPHEVRNLISDPSAISTLAEMQTKLDSLLTATK
ncbi:MAG: sulfatase [Rhodothermales bacterium]